MKANKIMKAALGIVPLLLILSGNVSAGGGEPQVRDAKAYNFCNKANRNSAVNMSIDFNQHDSFRYDRNTSFANPLFVGAAFKVRRSIDTFNIDKLTNVNDIAALSSSTLTNISRVRSGLQFTSSKIVGVSRLVCQNVVVNYPWGDFLRNDKFAGLAETLESQGCFKSNAPKVVTVQSVGNCSSYFNRTTLITFYSESNDGGSNILSLSLNSLKKKPNGILKSLMKNEIVRSLKKLPAVIETLK
jgi:hypothetical protein